MFWEPPPAPGNHGSVRAAAWRVGALKKRCIDMWISIHTYVYTYTYIRIYTCAYVYDTHIYIYMYINMYTQRHIHAHTNAVLPKQTTGHATRQALPSRPWKNRTTFDSRKPCSQFCTRNPRRDCLPGQGHEYQPHGSKIRRVSLSTEDVVISFRRLCCGPA